MTSIDPTRHETLTHSEAGPARDVLRLALAVVLTVTIGLFAAPVLRDANLSPSAAATLPDWHGNVAAYR